MAKDTLLTSVVVATDFSQGGHQALERALHLPLHPKCKVTLITVIPDDVPGKLRKTAIEEAELGLEKELLRVQGLASTRGVAPHQFVVDVLEGDSAREILKRANTVEAQVVCLGRHGRRPVADLFIGSTAQKVVRQSGIPVLVIHKTPQRPYARALVATDLKRSSIQLVKAAQRLWASPVELTLIHASRVPFEEYVTLSGELTRSYREDFLQDAQRELDKLVKKSKVEARAIARVGDARLLVLEEARSTEADVLVVGTHQKKALRRIVVGSVAEWLLSHAACDVLVVPA